MNTIKYKNQVGKGIYINAVRRVGTRVQHPDIQRNLTSGDNIKLNCWNGLEFRVSETEMDWLKCFFIGEAIDPQEILSHDRRFELEGILGVSITYMGGNLALTRALDGEKPENHIKEHGKMFSRSLVGSL